MAKKPHRYEGPGVMFQGSICAQKRLQSAGMVVLEVRMYKNQLGQCWEARTNRGRRWVSHSEEGGWTISKVPPTRSSAA